MSVYVIGAFVKMRAELAANATILKRLAEIDKTLLIHDVALREIFEKLRPLLAPPPAPPKPEIPRTAKALPLNGLAPAYPVYTQDRYRRCSAGQDDHPRRGFWV